MGRIVLSLACAALVATPSCLPGQNSAPAGSPAAPQNEPALPIFHTQSNLVLVDVVVRNHGQPVTGLPQSAFRVLEDGKPQNITIFEEHKATDATETVNAPPLPPGVHSNTPQYALTSAANVVLLDALNTPYSDQLYVRHQMLIYLRSIPAGTRVAVFTLSSRLRMIAGFGNGPAVLQTALTEDLSNPQTSPVTTEGYDAAMQSLTDIAQGLGEKEDILASMQQFQMDQQEFQMNARINMTIDAMDEIGRYLSTIPGRKNLIWFSGAFPPIAVGGGSRMGQAMEQSDFDDQIKKMNAILTLARVALYPVDSRGLTESSNFTAEANPTNPALLNSTPTGGGQPKMSQRIEEQNAQFLVTNQEEHDLMKSLAKATGGEAFINTNAVGPALGEAIANGTSYYTLGYTPQNQNYDGSYRGIQVKLQDAHADLAYRRGYFALKDASRAGLMPGKLNPLIAAMQPGAPELSQVLFRARALPAGDPQLKTVAAAPGPAGAMAADLKHPRRYVVDFWIQPQTVQLQTLPDGKQQAKVELTAVDFDPAGIRQNYNDAGLEVDMAPSEAAGVAQNGIHLVRQIDVPEGVTFLRLGVRDINTGRIGTVQFPLDARGH